MVKLNSEIFILFDNIYKHINMYKSKEISYIVLNNLIDKTMSHIVNIIDNKKYNDISEEQAEQVKNIVEEINSINMNIEVVYAMKDDGFNNLSEIDIKIINESIKFILFIIDKILKNSINSDILINIDGKILKSNDFQSYSINIQQDPSTKEYTAYLWKKNSDESGLEFNFKNKEDLQKFFDDNNILVQWEEA